MTALLRRSLPRPHFAALTSVVLSAACFAADQPDKKLATDTVFEVSVKYAGEQMPEIVQPGFLVGPEGVAITSYNALHSAIAANAQFFDQKSQYKVVLLAAEVSLDLALIKLLPAGEGTPPITTHLSLAPGDLKDGQPVWTLRASNTMDEAKAIAGLSKIQTQNVNRRADNPFDAPAWIYGNSNQDRQTGGCPMVDEEGRLVGINVWAWPGAESRPLGLTAKVVDDLLLKYRDESKRAAEKGEPAPTTQIAQLKEKYHDEKLIGSIFPRIGWPPRGDTTLAKAQAHNLRSACLCQTCDGDGKTTSKETDKRGKTRTKSETCDKCNGTGILPEDKLEKIGARAARAICSVPPGSEAYDDIVDELASSARELYKANRSSFTARINESARERLDPKRIKRGDAIMLVGSLNRRPPKGAAWDKDVAHISTSWDDKAQILAIAPDDGGKLDSGRSALIVGVVAGYVTAGRDNRWIVMERVTAVPLEAGPK